MTRPRFMRTIRFDVSDEYVFERAAEAEEWAIPGGFAFANDTADTLTGKRKQAFQAGFLGLESFGWSTFVVVAETDAGTLDVLAQRLAAHFVERYGAPSIEAALPVAQEEIAFARSLCDPHPVNTLLAVERELTAEGVRERFRTVVRQSTAAHARIFDIVDDGDAP